MKLRYCVVYHDKNKAGAFSTHIIYKKSLPEVERAIAGKDQVTVFPVSNVHYSRPCVTISDGMTVLYRLESKEEMNDLKDALYMMKDAAKAGMVQLLK